MSVTAVMYANRAVDLLNIYILYFFKYDCLINSNMAQDPDRILHELRQSCTRTGLDDLRDTDTVFKVA